MDRYASIGVIIKDLENNGRGIENFIQSYSKILNSSIWEKERIVEAIKILLPDLDHLELGKNLDEKM